MNLHIGTSGYSYKEWKGSFYPSDLPAKKMLHFYAERFDAVEINSTFMALPAVAVVEEWVDAVPAEFRFVLKAPRRITHVKRLADAAEPLVLFCDVAKALKKHEGALLFQLPPNMKKDLARLKTFLALAPLQKKHRAAFEFRHPSWFDDEVFDLLHDHHAALCIADADDDLEVPFVATTDWGYLRLRRLDYTDAKLKAWATRVREQKWKQAFVFFKHEDEARGPRFAKRFKELAQAQEK